ncbi:MAG: HesA/MoeB/ThiF family protein [Chitinophagaceae bacterium]
MEINSSHNRYHRQLILPGFGKEAQEKLRNARVLVVGAGGLGCPVLMNLTGMGVGEIGIIDNGIVELSNLHRQLLYDMNDIGEFKTTAAVKKLQRMNPEIRISSQSIMLTNDNALKTLEYYDLVVDCTDNFPTRYMLTDACWLLKKPLIFGAVARYDGQVAVFHKNITYRDLFPEPPSEGEVPNCNEAGVLGVLPNIIGNIMAAECIKVITGIGEILSGKLFTYSALTNDSLIVEINASANKKLQQPQSAGEFEAMNYPALCATRTEIEIDKDQFEKLIQQKDILLIDVREPDEVPQLNIHHKRIPLNELMGMSLEGNKTVVFICQSGKRSIRAVRICEESNPALAGNIFSLAGGINSLHEKFKTN